MGWIIVLAILVTPFVLTRFSAHLPARLGLAAFWLACMGGGGWSLKEARRVGTDLETVQTYPLPSAAGVHRIALQRLSQGSMKGVLRGGDGPLARADLEKGGWSFTDPKIPATWFDPREHDPAGSGETLLFYVDWMGSDKSPAILEYRVEESRQSWFQGRVLAIGHDSSAKHMLQDHAQMILELFGWGLLCWGGLWLIVQIAGVVVRRPTPGARDSPTGGAP